MREIDDDGKSLGRGATAVESCQRRGMRSGVGGTVGFLGIGGNGTRVFGLPPDVRARRFAAQARLVPGDGPAADGGTIVADLGYAWSPAWLPWLAARPGTLVTCGGRPAIGHAADAAQAARLAATMRDGAAAPSGFERLAIEDGASLYDAALRKREDAYLMPLTAATAPAVERASYDASYKGVTDLLTLYLWRGAAFHLTRRAAAIGLSPNAVTVIGMALCVAAFCLFLQGRFAAGLAFGLVFMVLDTVDGKLARCTGTSSAWGNVLDHGVDLVHPPFWYWAWGIGLARWGLALPGDGLLWVMVALVAGYAAQRAIEGAFIASFRMHIHVWRRFDSRFRLVTARRNPNVVILAASLPVARPDWGLIGVTAWTLLSCAVHLARLGLAYAERARGREIASWLA